MGSRLGPLVRSGCGQLFTSRLISDTTATAATTAVPTARGISEIIKPAVPPPIETATELSRESQLRNRREAIQAAIREKAATSLLPPFEDNFGRKHTYLRIALTEKCNLRCLYCMPAEGVPLTPKPHLLTVDEIIRIVEVFAAHGMDKIRLTGGEPSVRKDFTEIVRRINAVEGVTQIGVTTNGIAIGKRLHELKEAGLSQMNISLDSLNPEKYMMITRTNGFKKVMETIKNAEGIFDSVKVNVVVMKNVNDMEICDFIEMTKERNLSVRFIEFMPFGGNKFTLNKFFSYKDMWQRVQERFGDQVYRLVDTPNDTTKAFRIRGYQGEFGFITSMTEHFCSTCNRVRVTADGNLKVCLHGNSEVSLRDVMRSGASDEELSETISKAVKRKKKQHAGSLLTHVRGDGTAHQVDVSEKAISKRTATAQATILLTPAILSQLRSNNLKKGDVLSVARIASICAAKATSSLIPLCHNIPITKAETDFEIVEEPPSVLVTSTVSTVSRTGVEMEALTAAAVAALTIYDMCKAVAHEMTITDVRLISKQGGKRDFDSRKPLQTP